MNPRGDPHGASLVSSAFASLQTKQDRQTALDQLLDLLQPEEWRRVYSRASRTLQRDIIGCLPLELVVVITTYLDPPDILRLQRVSKQWQARLSSSAVYRSVLRFYCVPETETNLSTEKFRTLVRQRYNLETGSPCHEAIYPWLDGPDYSVDTVYLGLVSYCSGKVAWVSRDHRRAFVRDLQTGTVTDFVPVTRGTISMIHISEAFLFVQDSGHCTVWDLATEQSSSVRIPSSSLFEVNIRGKNVAMILRSPAQNYTLYSWNLPSGSLRSVDLDAIPILTQWNEDASVVTVIELNFEQPYLRFLRTKYAIADDNPLAATPQDQTSSGQSFNDTPKRPHNLVLIDSKILVTRQNHNPPYSPFKTAFDYNRHLCRYGTAVTQSLANPFLNTSTFICYRASTDHLTVLTVDDATFSYHIQSKLISPEGLVYSSTMRNEFEIHSIFTPHIKRRANFPINHQGFFQGNGWLAFGNPQLYGVIGAKGIAVWSFDPDLKFY